MTDSEKLDLIINSIQGLRQDVDGLKTDMAEVKQDISGLKADVTDMKQDISNLKTDVTGIKVDIENVVKPNIQLLAENYVPAAKRYETESGKIENLETDVDVLKKVVAGHSEKLQQLA